MEFIYPPYKRKEKIPLNNLFLGRDIRKFVHLIFEKYLIFINHKPQKKKSTSSLLIYLHESVYHSRSAWPHGNESIDISSKSVEKHKQ